MNYEEIEQRVNRGELTIREAILIVASETARADRYDLTTEFQAVACALNAHHLIGNIVKVEGIVSNSMGTMGFGLYQAHDYQVTDEDRQTINAICKAILEAGSGGNVIEDFNLDDVYQEGDIMISHQSAHSDWEAAITEFRAAMERTLGDTPEPPTNKEGQ